LCDKSVQVGVCWALDVEVAAADVVKSLVIKTESTVGVLKEGVGRKHVVVWLNDGSGNLGSRCHGEGKLGLAAIVDRQTLKKEGAKTRSSSSAC